MNSSEEKSIVKKSKNKLDDIYDTSTSVVHFSRKYCEYLAELILKLDHKTVEKIINVLLEAESNDKTVYFIGNGGSAATATHFACDLGKGTKNSVNMFKTNALADNFATFTAYANDHGYEYAFSRQLENLLNKGDVLFCISASGNSPNLINAIEYAKKMNAKTISILGFDGGKMKHISDVALVIETEKGEYAPVEDIHIILNHLITVYIYKKLETNGI